MPWTIADADQHNEGLAPAAKRKWLAVANNALTDTGDERQSLRIADASVREGGLPTIPVREGVALDAERARRHGHRGYAVVSACGACIRVELLERAAADRYTPAEFREKSDGDHFHGAWRGGPASSGGGPASVKGRGTKEERTKELAAKVGAENVGNTDNLKGVKSEGQKPSTKAALGKSDRPGDDDKEGQKAYDEGKARGEAMRAARSPQENARLEQRPSPKPNSYEPGEKVGPGSLSAKTPQGVGITNRGSLPSDIRHATPDKLFEKAIGGGEGRSQALTEMLGRSQGGVQMLRDGVPLRLMDRRALENFQTFGNISDRRVAAAELARRSRP